VAKPKSRGATVEQDQERTRLNAAWGCWFASPGANPDGWLVALPYSCPSRNPALVSRPSPADQWQAIAASLRATGQQGETVRGRRAEPATTRRRQD
jgi:hypothetical protein